MIIEKLVRYYDRLERDPNTDIAAYGFSRQKISYAVVLHPDGRLHGFESLLEQDGKRQVPAQLVVPGQSKPAGSGIGPCFLWDNAQYMLGYKPDDPKPDRTQKAFAAFRDRHLALREEIDDDGYRAVCTFLENWSPDHAEQHPQLADVTIAFGVFRLLGETGFVHDRPTVRTFAETLAAADPDAPRFPSLVTGEQQPIARLHEPKIKGVAGGQSSGAVLVGFNAPAFRSYGKDGDAQGLNAPVGQADAFKYCTALNRLTGDRERRIHIGDTTVVYWSEQPTAFEADLPFAFENYAVDPEDPETLKKLEGFFSRLRRAADGSDFHEEDQTPFYILGLAPNAARVSVRFWLVGTVKQFAARLGRHLRDLEFGGKPPNAKPFTIQRIADQTARERKEISPLLGGAILKAVLTGGPYPQTLAAAVIRRIRAEREVWYQRAAILKAYLTRKQRLANNEETIPVALDTNEINIAYRLGRLFAALEKTQEDAYDNSINATIKDRFLSSASASPRTAFGRLFRMHAHHLDKFGSDKRGFRVRYEKLVQEIMWGVPAASGFPSHLSLDDQSLFFIGYYHQRQAFFAKSAATNETETTNTEG